MPRSDKTTVLQVPPVPATDSLGQTTALRRFVIAAGVLTLGFSPFLYQLLRYSLSSDLYSHIPLIPIVAAYLVWIGRDQLPRQWKSDLGAAAGFLVLGAVALAGYVLTLISNISLSSEDRFALLAGSYVLLFVGTVVAFLGRKFLRVALFPLSFLVFMIPMPTVLHEAIETFLQHGSADVSALMIRSVGTPLFRDGLVFQLPGITLQVAPECSGIHSTLALFITSTVAGYLFLRSNVHRAILVVAVIPLALMRNGFRIFTIGELCVHVSPEMIHSYIHRQGGPIFFALSLIPFSLLLYLLRRRERRVPLAVLPQP